MNITGEELAIYARRKIEANEDIRAMLGINDPQDFYHKGQNDALFDLVNHFDPDAVEKVWP